MDPIPLLSLVCSSIGAVLFAIAVVFEFKIIKKLKQIKKPISWAFLTFFTLFFILGYIVNIISIIWELEILQQVFGALVFIFGAIFLLIVIIVSFHTYGMIFEAAEST
ncbi:hypothetical protein NEF87_001925 [Candidatus Lokiarchaeum ossiferum]|uniref:Uncharacterized protein n=1 Tax=Candidatus Lokiarchaeum ossiferum TaxID=2951803 RepID=A0ABY6HQ51_9ARCH|nr:hypothetical protein NEF87_001925 [Candidatus Lokiarchaeum sp. B-35]